MNLNSDNIRGWRVARFLWRHRLLIYAAGIASLVLVAINGVYGYTLIPLPYGVAIIVPIFLALALSFIAPAMKIRQPSEDERLI
jgi:hypothetical protein